MKGPLAVQRAGSRGRLPLLERSTGFGHRETYAGVSALPADVAHVGLVRYARAADELPEHVHPRCVEVCYVVRGTLDWHVGRRAYEVGPGQVFFTLPGEFHGGLGSQMQPCELYFVQVRRSRGAASTWGLLGRLWRMESRCFSVGAEVEAGFERMLGECRRPDELSATVVRAALDLMLSEVVRAGERAGEEGRPARALTPPVERALAYLQGGAEPSPRVAELASAAGLGRSQFCRRFREEVGVGVHEFVLGHRLRQVRRALASGEEPVTAIAHRFGFCSSQYLATAFGRYFGMTPAAYRRAAREAGGDFAEVTAGT